MMPVREREHRLGLGERVEVERGLTHRPGLDREVGMLDHAALEQLGQIGDDDVGAVRSQRVGLADAVDADDEAEPARPSRRDAGERVLEHRRLARAPRRACGGGRNMSGAGLPRRCSRSATIAVDPHLEQIGDAGRLQHLAAVGAGGDDRAPQAGVTRRLHEPHRALVGLDASRVDHRQDELVLAVTEAGDRVGVGGSSGDPSGSSMPRDARNDRTPSKRCFPST